MRIALVDLKLRIILDKDVLAIALVAWTWIALMSPNCMYDFVDAMIHALVWTIAFQALRLAHRMIKKREGIGFGDVKLVAATAPLLDIESFALSVSISSALGLVYVMIRPFFKGNTKSRYVTVPLGFLLIITIYMSWLLHAIDY